MNAGVGADWRIEGTAEMELWYGVGIGLGSSLRRLHESNGVKTVVVTALCGSEKETCGSRTCLFVSLYFLIHSFNKHTQMHLIVVP